jgi:gluconate 2-dehydrogenase gamma chain
MKGNKGTLARRDFVVATVAAGTALLAACGSTQRSGWDFLSNQEARALTAICDQIIPADDFPSASQAGAVDFIDRQLARHFRRHRSAYRDGLKRADALSRRRYGSELAALALAQQLEVVRAIEQEDPEFFELVRDHTLDGYYGAPRHGGNRDAVSWRMLGLAEPPILGRTPSEHKKSSAS